MRLVETEHGCFYLDVTKLIQSYILPLEFSSTSYFELKTTPHCPYYNFKLS